MAWFRRGSSFRSRKRPALSTPSANGYCAPRARK
jgi:hypothetical protein